MNKRIREHVAQYCKKAGWDTDKAAIIEEIREAEQLYREELVQRRWWNEYLYVGEVDGMLIGYEYAEASGDGSVDELGYEFDPSTIREMRPVEKIVIVYEPVTKKNLP